VRTTHFGNNLTIWKSRTLNSKEYNHWQLPAPTLPRPLPSNLSYTIFNCCHIGKKISSLHASKALFSQEVHRFTSSVGCYTDDIYYKDRQILVVPKHGKWFSAKHHLTLHKCCNRYSHTRCPQGGRGLYLTPCRRRNMQPLTLRENVLTKV